MLINTTEGDDIARLECILLFSFLLVCSWKSYRHTWAKNIQVVAFRYETPFQGSISGYMNCKFSSHDFSRNTLRSYNNTRIAIAPSSRGAKTGTSSVKQTHKPLYISCTYARCARWLNRYAHFQKTNQLTNEGFIEDRCHDETPETAINECFRAKPSPSEWNFFPLNTIWLSTNTAGIAPAGYRA